MFKKWFQPKWMHAQPEIRRMAIATMKLEKPEHAQALERLALEDVDDDVRLAAANRIEAIHLLLKVYLAAVSKTLRVSLAELLIQRTLKAGDHWVVHKELLEQIREVEVYQRFINSEYPDSFVAWVMVCLPEDQAFFADLAQNFGASGIRREAAERLTEPDLLRTVLETAKNKDKSVYRIVKQKLDALREVERSEADQREAVTKVLAELKRLAQIEPDPLLPHKIKQLTERWQSIDIDRSAWQAEFDESLNQVTNKDQQFQADLHREQEMVATEAAAHDDYKKACTTLEEAMSVISAEEALEAIDLTSLQQVVDTQNAAWSKLVAVTPPSAEQQARFQKLQQQIRQYVDAIELLRRKQKQIVAGVESLADLKPAQQDQIEKIRGQFKNIVDQIQWPLEAKRPSLLTHMTACLKQADQLLSESKQAISALESSIRQHIKKLKQAIDSGSLKDGQSALREIHALLRDLPLNTSEAFQKELRGLMQSLNELRDWQGFATIPKKQALLAKMQALAEEVDLPPQDRAERVKQLQQSWRDLGAVQSPEEKALWSEFKAAGEKAFEPCKAFFDDQQQQRAENLKAREAILEQLDTYLAEHDWENAIWPLVLETLKASRAQWRGATPVDRKHHQKTQKRFDTVMGQIQQKVDAERERNAQRKAKLVEQATELLDTEDLDAAIETMKSLQITWKRVGIMNKDTEQRLWQAFQKAADALFGQRKRRRQDQDQERAENKQRVIELTQSVQALANQEAVAVLEQQDKVKSLSAEFEQIAPLPKAEAKGLRQQFRSAVEQYEQVLAAALVTKTALSFEQLLLANKYLDQFERALSQGEADTVQLTALKETWQQVKQLPSGSDVGVNTRFDEAVAAFDAQGNGAQVSDAERIKVHTQLHDIVLQLEILLGIESPSVDQNQRMTLQVSRLSDKLGGKSDQRSENSVTVESLIVKWCMTSKLGIFPQIERIDARFQQAFKCWHSQAIGQKADVQPAAEAQAV